MLARDLSYLAAHRPSVLIVGSGPAGVLALELARRSLDVAVIESGYDGFDCGRQELAEAEILAPERHAPMATAVCRSLGGTSLLWAGRCVPFDDIDFEERAYVPFSGWPITHGEIRPWYRVAARYLGCGPPDFIAESTPGPGSPAGEGRIDTLERWSTSPNLRRAHADAIDGLPRLHIHLGVTATNFLLDPASGFTAGVVVKTADGSKATIRARTYIAACGGLGNARLLLTTQAHAPGLFGGAAGALGRFYMGHLSGKIAEITFRDDVVDGASPSG